MPRRKHDDIDDFIVPDDEVEESEDSDAASDDEAPPRRRAESSSDDEAPRRPFERSAVNDDDDEEDSDDAGVPAGYLYCALCAKPVVADSFSAKQKKAYKEGEEAYCLLHSQGDHRLYIEQLELTAARNLDGDDECGVETSQQRGRRSEKAGVRDGRVGKWYARPRAEERQATLVDLDEAEQYQRDRLECGDRRSSGGANASQQRLREMIERIEQEDGEDDPGFAWSMGPVAAASDSDSSLEILPPKKTKKKKKKRQTAGSDDDAPPAKPRARRRTVAESSDDEPKPARHRTIAESDSDDEPPPVKPAARRRTIAESPDDEAPPVKPAARRRTIAESSDDDDAVMRSFVASGAGSRRRSAELDAADAPAKKKKERSPAKKKRSLAKKKKKKKRRRVIEDEEDVIVIE